MGIDKIIKTIIQQNTEHNPTMNNTNNNTNIINSNNTLFIFITSKCRWCKKLWQLNTFNKSPCNSNKFRLLNTKIQYIRTLPASNNKHFTLFFNKMPKRMKKNHPIIIGRKTLTILIISLIKILPFLQKISTKISTQLKKKK